MIGTLEEFVQTTTIKLKRFCDGIFGVTKYYLDIMIEILDIYPLITFVEALSTQL